MDDEQELLRFVDKLLSLELFTCYLSNRLPQPIGALNTDAERLTHVHGHRTR